MSVATWGRPWNQTWDAALDRLERGLDRIETELAPGAPDPSKGAEAARSLAAVTPEQLAHAVAGLEPLPTPDGQLPAHLVDRAQRLVARTDDLALRVAGELSRTKRALRDLTHRLPDRNRHPAYVDTRA